MNLKLIAIAAAGVMALPVMGADGNGVVDYFKADFTGGIPAGVGVADGDGQKLHFLMVQAGFDQGDSWKIFTERSNGNKYVGSPSMHETAGTAADDRLSLPEIFLRGAESTLSWKCRSINEQSRTASTYSIVINGKTVVDRAEAPVSRTWQDESLSLKDFEGERVSIVFVNNTTDGEVLALDDIVVSGLPGAATVSVLPGEYAFATDGFQVGVRFTASSGIPVTSVGLSCEADGQTYTAEADGLNLTDGASTDLMIDHLFNLELGSSMGYTLTPSVNGVPYDAVTCTTTQLAFMPRKRVVVEEGTGMWCGWCPLGIVATDSLHMKYGDDVIPIAIHFDARQDYLAMDDYAGALNIIGAPYGLFDRRKGTADPLVLITGAGPERYTMSRGGFGTLAEECFAQMPEAEINAELTDRGFRMAEITTTTRFATNPTSTYSIAMVLVENDVWGANYYQNNYLANFSNRAPVGGYDGLPEVITSNYKFQHVARAVAEDAYAGMEGSMPDEMVAGEEYTFTKRFVLPASVDMEKASVVAMLLDMKTGAVVNACQVSTADPAGISGVVAGEASERVSVADGSVTVECEGVVSAALVDIAGRTVASATGNGAVTLSAPKGLYILHTQRSNRRVVL